MSTQILLSKYPARYAATFFVGNDDGTAVTIATSVLWGFSTCLSCFDILYHCNIAHVQ